MTSAEQNRQTVLAYVAAMNAGAFERLRELFTPDATIYGVIGAGDFDFAVRIWRDLHHGLNMHLTPEAITTEADTVTVRYTESGRWTGPFLHHTTPTGKSFHMLAIEWFEMKGGLIHRRWGARDSGTLARQVGFDATAQAA